MPEKMINGYRMHYEVYGKGPALTIVHGGLGGGEGCAAMVEHHGGPPAARRLPPGALYGGFRPGTFTLCWNGWE